MADRLKKAISVKTLKVKKNSKDLVVGTEDDFYRDYTIKDKIGEGAFATVHLCTNSEGVEYAVKLVDKSRAGIGELKDIWHEVNIMKDLNHRGIVYLHGNYEGDENIIIIMNRVSGGTLFSRIIAMKHYTEENAAHAVHNLLDALAYLHSFGIAHRDIKPENLLLKNKIDSTTEGALTDVVIADFGLASRAPLKSTCGSPCYLAPEVITATFGAQFHRQTTGHYDAKCDVWSLGVVLYVMLSGKFPFAGTTRTALFNQILNAEVSFPAGSVWDTVSSDAKHFISFLLTKNPAHRPTSEEALKHRWITGEGLLQPLQRVTSLAQSVKELKAFTMKKHVAAAMSVYRVGALFSGKGGGSELAFRKYVKANPSEDPFSLCIPVQSQSCKETVYKVDLGELGRRVVANHSATGGKPHQLNSVCGCPSNKICRHIQYVYQWLFVGDRVEDVVPHMSDCEERRQELVEKVREGSEGMCLGGLPVLAGVAGAARCLSTGNIGGAVAAAAVAGGFGVRLYKAQSGVGAAFEELQKADEFILCAWKLKHAFDLTPESERKSVLTGSLLPGALNAFTNAGQSYRQRSTVEGTPRV